MSPVIEVGDALRHHGELHLRMVRREEQPMERRSVSDTAMRSSFTHTELEEVRLSVSHSFLPPERIAYVPNMGAGHNILPQPQKHSALVPTGSERIASISSNSRQYIAPSPCRHTAKRWGLVMAASCLEPRIAAQNSGIRVDESISTAR